MSPPSRRILPGLLFGLLVLGGWTSCVRRPAAERPGSLTPVPPASSDVARGIVGDTWADVVLGQPDFSSLAPNEVTGARIFNGGGVLVDRSVRPNRLYIYDGGNSRVLGLAYLGRCPAGVRRGERCTTDSDCPGSACDLHEGRQADLVLGQPDFASSACNGDSNYQRYPERAPASANTMCSMPEEQVSPAEGGSFANMAVDGEGNLFVPDFDNHRVLLFLRPFETDATADAVWGQPDFGGNMCNEGRGVFQPDRDSLCLRSPFNEGFVGGVGLDAHGNLWVTDNQNHRVLRFPYDPQAARPARTADLVLGQPDFTSGSPGSGLDRMFAPAAVRVDVRGSVYVADSLNHRVLVFDPPLMTGMPASRLLGDGLALNLPAGLEFDLEGNLWVNDSQNNQLLRFDVTRGEVDRVLFKDVPTYDGSCGGPYGGNGPDFYFPGPDVYQASYNVCDARGSIGIDSDGNVFVAASTFVQDVWRFPAPFPEPRPGIAHSADAQIFKPYVLGEFNHVSERGLLSPRGVTTWGGQIVVADAGRILFWESDPWSLENGQPADGVVGAPNFNLQVEPHFGPIDVDDEGRLWALRGERVLVYRLPLQTGEQPVLEIGFPLPVAGGGSIRAAELATAGLAASDDGKHLWVSDPARSRVFRIRNPLAHPVVDVVLGQLDPEGERCNRGATSPDATTLCCPAHLSLDSRGNLFVSDHCLEIQGNHRLLQYDASRFPPAPARALFAVPASRVYGTSGDFSGPSCQDALCGPWATAFDSSGRMFVGLNGYIGSRFPLIYLDPLRSPTPDATLSDYYSMAYALHVDAWDNLYVADLNRGRVLIYWMRQASVLPGSGAELPARAGD